MADEPKNDDFTEVFGDLPRIPTPAPRSGFEEEEWWSDDDDDFIFQDHDDWTMFDPSKKLPALDANDKGKGVVMEEETPDANDKGKEESSEMPPRKKQKRALPEAKIPTYLTEYITNNGGSDLVFLKTKKLVQGDIVGNAKAIVSHCLCVRLSSLLYSIDRSYDDDDFIFQDHDDWTTFDPSKKLPALDANDKGKCVVMEEETPDANDKGKEESSEMPPRKKQKRALPEAKIPTYLNT